MFQAVHEGGADLEFEFMLAEKLGMTVGELCQRMSQLEFEKWKIYLGRVNQRKELAAKANKIVSEE